MSEHEEEPIVLPGISLPGLAPIAARLDACVPELVHCADVFDWQGSLDRIRATPAALIAPAAATYGPNVVAGRALRQERTHFFSVMLIFTGAGPEGRSAMPLFKTVCEGALAALTGWRHPDGGSLIEPVAERLAHFDAQRQALTWEIRFKHRHHISNLVPTPPTP
ncbi:MAG: hypothetical protein Q7V31_03770 [Parvibaculum sp.]|uniref:phage tail terminator protein n=1 Tax=Parvibaculum sp. TaxID=2024848 RepID=UPI0027225501|nr:hypothetical protein [Parvibaculum sp.]MDO8838021.1 hypothetical protein [Parvibaculum sp.]